MPWSSGRSLRASNAFQYMKARVTLTLQAIGLRSLADVAGAALHTGLRPLANQYPDIVATSNGAMFAAYLFFPSSGCYVLVARWRNGAELYPFAVGR
jgi:hypothetical protein